MKEDRELRNAEIQRRYIENLKKNPARYAEYLEKKRARQNAYRNAKANDLEWQARQQEAKQRWYEENRGTDTYKKAQAENQKKHRENAKVDPHTIALRKEANRRFYEAHKEEIRAKQNTYNALHKEEKSVANKEYRDANREKIAAHKKAFYATEHGQELKKAEYQRNKGRYINRAERRYWGDPEGAHQRYVSKREEIIAYTRQHRLENIEEVRARERRYTQLHSKKKAATAKKWREENPEKLAVLRKYHEAMRRAAGSISREEIFQMLSDNINRFGVLSCEFCKAPITFEESWQFEHFYPINPMKGSNALRGRTSWANSRVACRPCNASKTNNDPYEWLDREKFTDGGSYRLDGLSGDDLAAELFQGKTEVEGE